MNAKLTEKSVAPEELIFAAVRMEMLRRGLTVEDIARECGVDRDTAQEELAGGVRSYFMRAKIERLLDFPRTLWSSPAEIEARRWCIARHHSDPRAMRLPELKELCRRLGTERPRIQRRESWWQCFLKWFTTTQPQTK